MRSVDPLFWILLLAGFFLILVGLLVRAGREQRLYQHPVATMFKRSKPGFVERDLRGYWVGRRSEAMNTEAQKTEKRNRKFAGMTKAQQRVAIARDALAWLKAKVLVAQTGNYVHTKNPVAKQEPGTQLRDVNLGACSVCAIGALFLAKANRFDGVEADEYRAQGSHGYGFTDVFHSKLLEHFGMRQLALIETAFERVAHPWNDVLLSRVEEMAAVEFGSGMDSDARLRAILTNIVRNDGTFVP